MQYFGKFLYHLDVFPDGSGLVCTVYFSLIEKNISMLYIVFYLSLSLFLSISPTHTLSSYQLELNAKQGIFIAMVLLWIQEYFSSDLNNPQQFQVICYARSHPFSKTVNFEQFLERDEVIFRSYHIRWYIDFSFFFSCSDI